jgi:hypothetical protein
MAAAKGKKSTTKKASTKAAEETKEVQQEAPAAEEKEKKPNVFLNGVSNKCIHEAKNGYTMVSFACPESKNGFGSIPVKSGQILDAKDKDGNVRDGVKNVLLGQEGRNFGVSIQKEDGSYDNVTMTAADIKKTFDDARKAYREKQAQAETPAPEAENEGASVEEPTVG